MAVKTGAQNIQAVDAIDVDNTQRPTRRRLLNDRRQFLALFGAEQLRVFDLRMSETARQDHRRRDHRTRQRPAADFIDAGHRIEAMRQSVSFECAETPNPLLTPNSISQLSIGFIFSPNPQ